MSFREDLVRLVEEDPAFAVVLEQYDAGVEIFPAVFCDRRPT